MTTKAKAKTGCFCTPSMQCLESALQGLLYIYTPFRFVDSRQCLNIYEHCWGIQISCRSLVFTHGWVSLDSKADGTFKQKLKKCCYGRHPHFMLFTRKMQVACLQSRQCWDYKNVLSLPRVVGMCQILLLTTKLGTRQIHWYLGWCFFDSKLLLWSHILQCLSNCLTKSHHKMLFFLLWYSIFTLTCRKYYTSLNNCNYAKLGSQHAWLVCLIV